MRTIRAAALARPAGRPRAGAPLPPGRRPSRSASHRDARRLLPRSLGMLMSEREKEIFEAAQRLPPELDPGARGSTWCGASCSPETIAALRGADRRGGPSCCAQQQVSEGVVQLGALLRIPADLSDPCCRWGPRAIPPGVTQRVLRVRRREPREDPGRARRRKPALKLEPQGPARVLARPPRPQPRAVAGHPHRDVPERPRGRPPHGRLPLAGVRRGLPRPTRGRSTPSPPPGSRSGARPTATSRACRARRP